MSQAKTEFFAGLGADGLGGFGDFSPLPPSPLHAKTKMIMAVNDLIASRNSRLTMEKKLAIVPPPYDLQNMYFELAEQAVTESKGRLGDKFVGAGSELIELGLYAFSHHSLTERDTAQLMVNTGINLILGQYLSQQGDEYQRKFANVHWDQPIN